MRFGYSHVIVANPSALRHLIGIPWLEMIIKKVGIADGLLRMLCYIYKRLIKQKRWFLYE